MPAPVAGIHVFLLRRKSKTWMAGTSPAMTTEVPHELVNVCLSPPFPARL
jgi:hypothetical protein